MAWLIASLHNLNHHPHHVGHCQQPSPICDTRPETYLQQKPTVETPTLFINTRGKVKLSIGMIKSNPANLPTNLPVSAGRQRPLTCVTALHATAHTRLYATMLPPVVRRIIDNSRWFVPIMMARTLRFNNYPAILRPLFSFSFAGIGSEKHGEMGRTQPQQQQRPAGRFWYVRSIRPLEWPGCCVVLLWQTDGKRREFVAPDSGGELLPAK